jgi:hypothetical protein
MADQFTDVSSTSWFGRIGGALKGMFFGLLLLPVAVLLLFWNETRAVKTAKSLEEGSAAVISARSDQVEIGNDNKLIHLTGQIETDENIADPLFGLGDKALRLVRYVEMYQWKENKETKTRDKLGGGQETVTTYNYSKVWSNKLIDSTHFKELDGHVNPAGLPVPDHTVATTHAVLGAFKIPIDILAKIPGGEPLPPTNDNLAKLSPDLKAKARIVDNYIYLGNDPANPAPGDARIGFTVLRPATFSILARQTGDALASYHTHAGREIERIEPGDVSADAMFQHAARENTMLTWGLRAGGFLLMWLAFVIVLNPLHVLAEVVPFIGGIVEFGSVLVAGILGFAGSVVIIAVAWLASRPLLGVTLLLIALAAIVHGIRKIHQNKPTATAAA